MIKVRNLGELWVHLENPALQAADDNVSAFLVPFALRLKAIYAKLVAAGTTGNQIVDVHKNGTTIFTGATKLTFATTSQDPTYDTLAADPTTFAKGDIVSVDVDSVHSTPAEGLILELVFERTKTGPAATVAQTGGFGADAE